MAYCSPFSYRVARRSAPFFPSAQADFAPLFSLFNELDNHVARHGSNKNNRQALRSFQPRFDVREEQDAYHLQGELPGIDQNDINIEFVDPTTLVVRGQTVRERKAGTQPKTTANTTESEQQQDVEKAHSDNNSDAVSETGSNYHQPSVEETQDEDWTDAAPTPATTATELAKPVEEPVVEKAPAAATQEVAKQQQKQEQQQQQGHYWVSERSVGTFQRAFNFSKQVDQDAVTANLKNGILSIVVPKQQPKQPRRIVVQ